MHHLIEDSQFKDYKLVEPVGGDDDKICCPECEKPMEEVGLGDATEAISFYVCEDCKVRTNSDLLHLR